jgi:putative membrane protein
MNKKKLIASVLTVAMLVGAAGASVYAVETNKPENQEGSTSAVKEEKKDSVSEDVKATGKELSKEETVYVMADATGTVNKVIVSDWLKNGNEDSQIKDETVLKDIKNVKGNESYNMEADGSCVWDAKGHDIYYQGTTDKKPPVDLKVSYTLDGQAISASEIAGKSGKVTIRFDYTNNEKKSVRVNGRQEELFVPFAMLTGMIMDNEVFSNIEVTNGKIVNEGEKTIVTGLAFPGLADDLGLTDSSDIDIPGYFEVTADVKDFAMKNTITVGTTSVFDTFNTDKFDSGELRSDVDKLTDGMEDLIDGSSELYDGVQKLLDGTDELEAGVYKLASGSSQLYGGMSQLKDGSSKLAAGTKQLQDSVGSIDVTALKGALGGIGQLTTLGPGIEQLFNGYYDKNKTNAVAAAQFAAQKAGLTTEQAQAVEKAVSDALEKTYDGFKAGEAYQGLQTKLGGLGTTVAGLSGAAGKLDDLEKLSGAAKALNEGAQGLDAGIAKAQEGAGKLNDGIQEMEEKMPEFVDGVKKLSDGTMELSDGLKKFRDEGISKITELVDGELGTAADRLGATVDAAKSYSTFAGLGKDMNGTTKFIYKTDEIK